MTAPILKPCSACGSLYCGPMRCRFRDPSVEREEDEDYQRHRYDQDRDERLDELREQAMHPERYR